MTEIPYAQLEAEHEAIEAYFRSGGLFFSESYWRSIICAASLRKKYVIKR